MIASMPSTAWWHQIPMHFASSMSRKLRGVLPGVVPCQVSYSRARRWSSAEPLRYCPLRLCQKTDQGSSRYRGRVRSACFRRQEGELRGLVGECPICCWIGAAFDLRIVRRQRERAGGIGGSWSGLCARQAGTLLSRFPTVSTMRRRGHAALSKTQSWSTPAALLLPAQRPCGAPANRMRRWCVYANGAMLSNVSLRCLMNYDWPALRWSVSFTSAISDARREVSYENTLRDAALRTRKRRGGFPRI